MQSKFFFALGALGISLCPAQASVSNQVDVYSRSIQELGGKVVDPAAFPKTLDGFQQFLTASTVRAFTAMDLTRPNHPDVAARLGFQNFLPPQTWWPRGAALALLAQNIQDRTRSVLHVRNWWRPQAYNLDPAVKGAKDGDHPSANAFDVDYPSVTARMAAEQFLRELERRAPWMQLSLGLGAQTTHVGLASPRGHREWHYAGWRPALSASYQRAAADRIPSKRRGA